MGKSCAALVSLGLLAGCANGGSQQSAVLRQKVTEVADRVVEVQQQVSEVMARQSMGSCRLSAGKGTVVGSGFPVHPDRLSTLGKVNVAVLFVDFPDAQTPQSGASTTKEYTLTEKLFNDVLPSAEKYFEAMSYGALDLTFQPHHKWLRVSGNNSSYGDFSTSGRLLVEEAIGLADPEFSFEEIGAVVVIAAPGAKSFRRAQAHMSPFLSLAVDGETIANAVSLRSDGSGWDGFSLAHELGHNFGLPDLYDRHVEVDPEGNLPGEVDRFVGGFGIMGGFLGGVDPAVEMFAWSRWQLGWLRDSQVACITAFPASMWLTPLVTRGGIKAAVVPLTETRALVVEYRRQLGYDLALGEEGALIYKVDSSVSSGEGPIVIGSISKPPDASALLQPGETWDWDGYSINVKAATPAGAYIRISTSAG